ncbi:amino acid adenylation domain-containing protein [Variovorax sp. J22R133]|uniref:non-ribosomal peptide synthetase n=1 Tax=Variovorax brevis TaxID=3053503 RepID=UPI002577364A|nr:non-ribosomal peptide synthetase [Variovorax sp. J22R133]MDM0115084.1 amino acid adenylation domain-containing protein [Variovorax sp. J22R133]
MVHPRPRIARQVQARRGIKKEPMRTAELPSITPEFDPFACGAIERVIGTTEAQREIWLADKLSPEASLAYNESISLTLRGELDFEALQTAVNQVVARHESLRATVAADGMELMINEPTPFALARHDLGALQPAARAEALARARTESVATRFDLENGPLFRAALYRCEPQQHELLLTTHHIVCDGWSWGLVVEDIGLLYAQQLGLAPELDPPATYEQFVRQEGDLSRSAEAQENTRFWLDRFGGHAPLTDLPTDRPRPAMRTFQADRLDVMLDGDLIQKVRKQGGTCGASLFATLFGAFAGTLHRLTQQGDLIIGVPSAGQAVNDMPNLVGHCVNLLPIHVNVDSSLSMKDLVRQSSTTLLDAFEHNTVTYGTLLKKLALPRDPSRPTLVSVMFNLDRDAAMSASAYPGLEVDLSVNPRQFENFELFVNCAPTPQGLRLECQYNTGLFDECSVRRWLEMFQTALERFVADAGISVTQAFALGDADRNLLAAFNSTEAPYDRAARIESLIADQAAATPDAIAIVAGAQQLSYRELNQRANALALVLQERGVGAGELVGLCCARSEHMLVALVGILKAGAGYVPLDPSFPQERLAFMARDAGLRVLVADESTQASWADKPVEIVLADGVAATNAAPVSRGTAEDVAYVIYTSGSTGQPKGVRVPHRTVVNLLTSLRKAPGMEAKHTVLAVTTLSFDIAVSEVIMPLSVGARIVVADKAQASDGDRLRELVEREGVNFIDATPSTWRLLLDAGWPGRQDLVAICTGEPLPPDLGRKLLHCVGALWNGYGPTETTVWSSFHRLDYVDTVVPIGRPVANTAFHVLDAQLQPLPVGVVGELYIAGAGVTLGYLNRPDLTAERFLPDPTSADAQQRWYKTGDLGRWRKDGVLECLGRADHQVKVRGYRIELGEIESNLGKHPGVAQSLVITREDVPGDVRIVAYVVPRGAMPAASDLKRHLAGFLPDYMVPAHFVELAAVPQLPNGKLDRKSLPPPDVRAASAVSTARIAPSSAMERLVVSLMEKVLNLPELSMDDDFFALGGHSLLASRLTSQLSRALDMKVPLGLLFEAPSAQRLSAAIDQLKERGNIKSGENVVRRARQGSAPLTPMQERIRFLEELHPGRSVYNVPSAHRLTGPLDRQALEATLQEIVRRQPALRSYMGVDPETGAPAQLVKETLDVELPFEDLRHIPHGEREAALRERLQAVSDAPMDIHRGPLFVLALYQLADEEHALAFVPHHLIWDGWSFAIFLSELSSIYAALSNGRPSPLPELAVTYGDYASWYKGWLSSADATTQLGYWKQRFAKARPSPSPRTDMPRRAGMTGEGRSYLMHIDKATTERLRDISRDHNVTLNMLTLAVLVLMMSQATGSPSVVIATPVRGREAPELESVMGFFNNLLPLPFEVDGQLSLGQFLAGIKREVVSSMNSQQVPFERLASEPEFTQRAQRSAMYQAMFSYQDARDRPQQVGALRHQQIHLLQSGATDDLGVWLLDKPNGIEGAFMYNAEIYLPETGEAFRDRYVELLHKLAAMPDAKLDVLAANDDSQAGALLQRLNASDVQATDAQLRLAAQRANARQLLLPEQARLAQVWAGVLGIDVNEIHATDNFFDLGGDSLLAMRAVQQAEQSMGFRIEARRYLFESLAQLSSNAGAKVEELATATVQDETAPRGLLGRMMSAFGRK